MVNINNASSSKAGASVLVLEEFGEEYKKRRMS
jgi:hypothetical protein